ncbi:WXG100 family type VII secretion target [Mycolicibacterium diernhoferi]|uniref:WXG100 family type VII secretion target n=1 Tax=Mycolicibacterium diernhoferi TaxID=1801 RepID=A0A1Q4H9F7_9MYCO|nr:WXG100 family type VII secretion target [Mycolicibacterium diernhoferi]OJZ64186.1 hypothetical protein BRW64_18990 [Mycolicibacterium diernhoferi]OPE56087.1 hypothetical protein BV510_01540 [Mycolicibacterium diernhoferi]PEG55209.1 hypothetical protein CRI78_06410 [Mycolicibacterium diernhoferi]QYL21770.1 WXG100 family type VII secretion target [Mycolicibacterium diernhoferi]
MGMVGADVDQLRGLARILIQAADRLEGMSGEVSGRLSTVSWHGSDSQQFRSRWQGDSQPQIRGVITALRGAAADIDRNANEQEQASASNGAASYGGAGSTVPFLAPTDVPALQLPNYFSGMFANPLAPFVDIRDFLNGNTIWPINNGFAIGEAIPGVGPVLPLLDALGIAGDTTLSPDDRIAESTRALTDLGGGLLKDLVPGPVGYLSGVAVAQWGDVAYEVSKADFSPAALQTTADYIASDPGGAFEAARDAVFGYAPKLISNLWK